MRIKITEHAIKRYNERVDCKKTPEGTRVFLFAILAKERAQPKGRRKICRVARDIDNGTFVYFYLKAVSPFGIVFYLAVDEGLTMVYTVLTEEQFQRTGRNKNLPGNTPISSC